MFRELVSTPTGAFAESLSRALESRIPIARHSSKSTVYTREHLLLLCDRRRASARVCTKESAKESDVGEKGRRSEKSWTRREKDGKDRKGTKGVEREGGGGAWGTNSCKRGRERSLLGAEPPIVFAIRRLVRQRTLLPRRNLHDNVYTRRIDYFGGHIKQPGWFFFAPGFRETSSSTFGVWSATMRGWWRMRVRAIGFRGKTKVSRISKYLWNTIFPSMCSSCHVCATAQRPSCRATPPSPLPFLPFARETLRKEENQVYRVSIRYMYIGKMKSYIVFLG